MNPSNVIFDADASMGAGGSHLRGYLFADAETLYGEEQKRYAGHDATWTFENVLARLNRIANQVIFDDGNFDKSSFTVISSYKGEYFNLYDYKGDKAVHIGGSSNLDLAGLVAELKVLINAAEPKPFDCVCSYSYQRYTYP